MRHQPLPARRGLLRSASGGSRICPADLPLTPCHAALRPARHARCRRARFHRLVRSNPILNAWVLAPCPDKIREFTLECFPIRAAEQRKSGIDRQIGRNRSKADGCRVAAPFPLLWPRDQASSHRVQDHVPRNRHHVWLILNNLRFVPSLKDMANAVVPPVPPLCIAAVQFLNGGRYIGQR